MWSRFWDHRRRTRPLYSSFGNKRSHRGLINPRPCLIAGLTPIPLALVAALIILLVAGHHSSPLASANVVDGIVPPGQSANGTTAAAALSLSGAVFTTDASCTGVDLNIYSSKDDVFINGGPARPGAAGLPDGEYFVKVTEPNRTLLGISIGSGDDTPVVVSSGEFVACYQLFAILIKASDGSAGYDDTSNPGGEYKVWVCNQANFNPNSCKTDNFKVKGGHPLPPPPRPRLPSIEVEKTADGDDANSTFTDDETASPGSPVTYRVVIDNDSAEPVTITSFTDDIYGTVTCSNASGNVVGQTLAADNGDGPGASNGGPDETTCTFLAAAPSTDATAVTDTVTVTVKDNKNNLAQAQDQATVRTPDELPAVEVSKTVDGSDPDSAFSDDETTSPGSTVTYRVLIDNDSQEPVTIISFADNVYTSATCANSDGNIVGQVLAADDGDGPGASNGGPDETTCTFQATAPSTSSTVVTDEVTVKVKDNDNNVVQDRDQATLRTTPSASAGITLPPAPGALPGVAAPTPTAGALPPTGGLGALADSGSVLALLAVIGATLLVGGTWLFWATRQRSDS